MVFKGITGINALTPLQRYALIGALLIMAVGSYGVVQLIENRYQDNLRSKLTTVHETINEAIKLWESEQLLVVEGFAREDHVRAAIKTLLATPRNSTALLASDAQQQIREKFKPYSTSYRGFFVIAPDNINLASSRDANVGTHNLLTEYPEKLGQLWGGKALLTPIQKSDITLSRSSEKHSFSGNETLFVGTPVKDEEGNIIALLTLRIDPYKTIFALADKGRLGESGETYFFGKRGVMLSRSRFESELINLGLLKEGQSSALNIPITDPGVDLKERDITQPELENQPLTKMVASAIGGNSDIDLIGYRDYRGVPVIGTWTWNDGLGVGVSTEQDVAEAYQLFYFVRTLIYGGALITATIIIILTKVFVTGKRELAQIQLRLQAIVETANDGIVVINDRGIIKSVNPAMETLFGYSAEQMIGNNVSMLMPEPYAREHDSYLAKYRKTSQSNIIGVGREISGRRKDGSTFPAELSVNRLEVAQGLHFAGIIRDISERKDAETQIKGERDFTRDVLDSLSASIAVLDEKGEIVLTNRAWREFAENNGLSAEKAGTGVNYLEVVQKASQEDGKEVVKVHSQLVKMLSGKREHFSTEYPCHSPKQDRWFQMKASRFTHQERNTIVISHIDITRRIEYEMQLKTLNEKLRVTSLVAESTDNIVIVTNPAGMIEWVNHGFTRVSGYDFEEVIGRKPGDLLQGPETDHVVARHIGEALRDGNKVEGEILNYSKSGNPYWIEFEITPVYDEQFNIVQFVALEKDITERKQTQEKIARLGRIVERSLNEIYIIDSSSMNLVLVNDGARANLGYSMDELHNMTPADIKPDYSLAEFENLVEPLRRGDVEVLMFETRHQRKDGSVYDVEAHLQYMRDETPPVYVAILQDITERKIAEREVQEARQAAEEANKAKSTFLATMSHEIRTPLNGVVGTVDMLAHTTLKESQLDLVKTAKESAVLLQGIIDDILDFSKIEAGRLELDLTSVRLEPLIEKLADSMQPLARQRDVELLIYCDPNLPKVKGDPVRIKQILFNLVGNAIKFCGNQVGRSGRVIVNATLEDLNDGRTNICLSVSDNGIGMSTEVQKRLFNAFVQGDADTTRRFGGTGLGLVITQRLVEMMSGHIEVESIEGEGATFSAHISLNQDTTSTDVENTNLDGIRVLLVNGDAAGWILKGYLQHAGAEVIPISADQLVDECDELCKEEQELVILIDTEGKRDEMFSLRDRVREELKAFEPRFLLVERGRRRYSRYEENDGLTLDLNTMHRSTLLNAVAALTGRESPLHREEADGRSDFVAVAETAAETAKKGYLILLADDNSTNRKVIGQQLRMLGYLPEFAEDGVEALKMWKEKDYSLVLTDCHMPEMDGYGLAESIRREEEGEQVPIIAITADAMKGTSQKCFAAGMNDYLTKPIQLDQLQSTLAQWLSEEAEEETEKANDKPKKAKQVKEIDPHVLGELLGTQEKEILSEYYEDFLNTSTPTVEQIQNAIEENNLTELAGQAHKLKSSARTVGANELADCCLELEMAGKEGDALAAAQQRERLTDLYSRISQWIESYCRVD
jgi:PAS domain S-box-containing protein